MEVAFIIILVIIGVVQVYAYTSSRGIEVAMKKASIPVRVKKQPIIEDDMVGEDLKEFHYFVDLYDGAGDLLEVDSGEVYAINQLQARLTVLQNYEGLDFNLWYLKELKK